MAIIPYDFAKKVRAGGKTERMKRQWQQRIEKSISFMNKAFEDHATGVKVGLLFINVQFSLTTFSKNFSLSKKTRFLI